MRDDFNVAPTVPEGYRQQELEGHAIAHRMLRIVGSPAPRVEVGEDAVDRIYSGMGPAVLRHEALAGAASCADYVAAAGLEARMLDAADDERWDLPIRRAMEVAYAFGGSKTQTPAIVVRSDPPHGFKGPVMAPAPTGPFAVSFWDAIQVLSHYNGFFEITRPTCALTAGSSDVVRWLTVPPRCGSS